MMTGNTTQFMMDLADLARGSLAPAERQATLARLARLAEGVAAFAFGCAAAAALFFYAGVWCFAAPPLFVLAAILLHDFNAAKK
jgi:uncharacterized membrane protein YoaK (UPF0700 family)